MATIITKNSSTASSVPLNTQLVQGELAVNVTDKRLFTENASGTVVELGTNPSSLTLPNGTANGLAFLNASKVLTTGSALTFDGTNLGIGTSSPGFKLHVAGSGDTQSLTETTGTNQAASLIARSGNGTTSGLYAYARFVNNDTNAQDWRIGTYGSNNLTIANAKAGTTPVVLDTSGNLGLGVTPSAWNSGVKALQINRLGFQGNGSSGGVIAANAYYGASAWTYINSDYATSYEQSSGQHKWFTAPSGTAGNTFSFTQAMTLNADGSLGVGTTSPTAKFDCYGPSDVYMCLRTGSAEMTFNTGAGFTGSTATSIWNKSAIPMVFGTNNTERARIDSSGNLLPGADNAYSCGNSGRRWNAVWAAIGTIQTSDEREKTEIVDSPLGLDFIKSLRPVAYKFRVGGNVVSTDEQGNEVITPVPGKRQHFGLLAQQVKQTLGETDFGGWILTDPNDAESEQGLRYDEFISPLIKAIQEQQAIIESLKAQLTSVSEDVAALKAAA